MVMKRPSLLFRLIDSLREKQNFIWYWELWKINIVAVVLNFYHAVQDRMKKQISIDQGWKCLNALSVNDRTI